MISAICRFVMRLLLASGLLLSVSCSMLSTTAAPTSSKMTQINLPATGSFGERPVDILTPVQLHSLTEQQQSEFLTYFNKHNLRESKPFYAVADYLSRITEDYIYEGETLRARESFAVMGGDCMSLAILTTALAQLVGVGIDYQLMDDVPMYELNGQVVRKGVHIRTILYKPRQIKEAGVKVVSLFAPGITIDYFPTKRQRFIANLDEDDYLTMYYQNMAAQALADNQLNRAYWYAMEALAYDARNAESLNMLAVINRHAGNPDVAEGLYLYGIATADVKISLLKNYRVLLTDVGRTQEAEVIRQQLESMDDPSPFNWFQLARAAGEEGDFLSAIRYYRRALALAPYLHEAELGIAQASYQIGRKGESAKALKAAIEKAQRVSTKRLYEAKLISLRAEPTIQAGTRP